MEGFMALFRKIIIKLLYPFAKDCIVFESVPDFSDNSKAVYDEFITRDIAKKYYCLWTTNTNNKISPTTFAYFDKHKRPHFFDINKPSTIYQYLLYISYYDKLKCGICCNNFLPKTNKNEKLFFLNHGAPIKSVKGYYPIPSRIDYTFSPSEYFLSIFAEQYDFDIKKIVALGYPRNDILVKSDFDAKSVFNNDFTKIIVWYPTYRQHKSGFSTGTSNSIPLLYNAENAQKLNTTAKESNTLLLIKPHFAQDTSYIRELNLSNIKFINDDFFKKNNTSSYEFIAGCDALLTDYSSVYYDYLLCNKPIGVIWEDIEEYRSSPGFAVDLEYALKGAEKIYNLQELQHFIIDISNNVDKLKTHRQEICKLVNYSDDGKSSQRVVDFIINKANL